MRNLIKQFGRLRLLALVLTFLPLAALPLAGVVWLWQSGNLGHWLLLLAGCGSIAFALHKWLAHRDQQRTPEAITGPDEHWSPTAEGAWQQVEELANGADPADYSLEDGSALWQLAEQTLARVAGHFHPEKDRPLLELTLPHTLLIVERASRELRDQITYSVPFSHKLTLGNLARARRWQQTALRYHNAYRVGRALVSPATAVYKELSRAVGGQILDYGSDRLQRWLLQEYVRKVGFYAIELYSGNLLLGDWTRTGNDAQPLRVLVLGRAGSGKSSLIQALSGGTAEPEPGQDGKTLRAFKMKSMEWGDMLVWDTPAWETLPRREAKNATTEADLIVWVSHSGNIDAAYEASQLRRLERWLTSRSGQPQSPLLVALTHSEAANADSLKTTTAIDLGIARERIIAISLANPESSDTGSQLREAIAAHQHQASRSKHWRHFYQRKSSENREFIGQQLRNAGSSAWRVAKGVFSRGKKQ